MWIFCKGGFFSAVEHFDNKAVIHVRARFAGDLERLCQAHGVEPKVMVTPGNDYAYRMDFDRSVWTRLVAAEADQIDYANFKNAVHDGTVRDQAYLGVWSVLSHAQRQA